MFKRKKVPYREFKLKKLNEESLGELFSYFMLETILVGKVTNINPYNQPAVEKVKIYTKKNSHIKVPKIILDLPYFFTFNDFKILLRSSLSFFRDELLLYVSFKYFNFLYSS